MNRLTESEEKLLDQDYEVVESPELAAESLPATLDPSKPLAPSDIGKLRKQYVTIQHPIAAACGHRLDTSRQPRHKNCENCWFNWLNANGQTVQTAEELIAAGNAKLIVQLQGPKFLHYTLMFLSTVAKWKADSELSQTVSGEVTG